MNTAAAMTSVFSALAALVGEAHVSEDPARLAALAIDGTVPGARVSPGSAEEVAAVLRVANERSLTVVPAGGSTQQHIGVRPEQVDILLDTGRLTAVEHYDAGDLTFGVGAGATLAEAQRQMAANAQFLPLEGNAGPATIGGLMATAAQGPLRHGYGAIRDFCIGVQFVTGDGKLAKGGGRVVKNVAGYDLMKLLIGSYGTLGVITSASFKVFPLPRQTATFVCAFGSLDDAAAFRDRLVRSPLASACLELISPRAQEYLAPPHEPRDPDHYHPPRPVAPPSASWQIAVRAAGSDAVLARYRRDLGSAIGRELQGGEEAEFWTGVSDFERSVAARHRNAMVLQVSVPPQAVAGALRGAEQAATQQNCLFTAVGRAAIGTFVVALLPLAVDPPSAMQFANAASALRSALPPDGSAFVLRCPLEAKPHFAVWGTSPTDRSMMAAVKQAMDPNRVLNRGRFLDLGGAL